MVYENELKFINDLDLSRYKVFKENVTKNQIEAVQILQGGRYQGSGTDKKWVEDTAPEKRRIKIKYSSFGKQYDHSDLLTNVEKSLEKTEENLKELKGAEIVVVTLVLVKD